TPLFRAAIDRTLEEAFRPLERLARLSDADAAEIKQARAAIAESAESLRPLAALFDIAAVSRADEALAAKLPGLVREWKTAAPGLWNSAGHKKALTLFGATAPVHFPLAFPEVFRRTRPGFDVILGNPPWQEATLEEDDFWSRFDPGFQGLPQRDRELRAKKFRREHPERVQMFEAEQRQADAFRALLTKGPYPGMGKGDPDTYKAFAWRFVHLLREGGRLGVVLPRSALAAAGSGAWRKQMLDTCAVREIGLLQNTGGWVFADVHQQYTVGLVCLHKEAPGSEAVIPLHGPYNSLARFEAGVRREPVRLPLAVLRAASDTLSLPLLPSDESADAWLQMRKAPRLDRDARGEWRARPYAEFHATNDKPRMKFEQRDGLWPIYKGESFDLWNSDTGT
ncbi:MAG: hypothetical protein AAB368_01145, partial [bacterium]